MLFHLHLDIKLKKDGRLCYRIPPGYRIILIIIGLILLFSLILLSTDMNSIFVPGNSIPLLFIFLTLVSSVYHEQWIFNKKNKSISCNLGLIFLYKTSSYCLCDVKAIELTYYQKGRGINIIKRYVCLLLLHFIDGKKITIEARSSFSYSHMLKTGKLIAEYCDISFIHNKEP